MFVGYYKLEEKTAEAFDKDGWLMSGDIGLWTTDGALKIIGACRGSSLALMVWCWCCCCWYCWYCWCVASFSSLLCVRCFTAVDQGVSQIYEQSIEDSVVQLFKLAITVKYFFAFVLIVVL